MTDQEKINSFLVKWPIWEEVVNNIPDDTAKINFMELFNSKPLLSMVLELLVLAWALPRICSQASSSALLSRFYAPSRSFRMGDFC